MYVIEKSTGNRWYWEFELSHYQTLKFGEISRVFSPENLLKYFVPVPEDLERFIKCLQDIRRVHIAWPEGKEWNDCHDAVKDNIDTAIIEEWVFIPHLLYIFGDNGYIKKAAELLKLPFPVPNIGGVIIRVDALLQKLKDEYG